MNTRFAFKPIDVIWLDSLPSTDNAPRTVVGRMEMFVQTLKKRPGTYGKYPHVYKNGATTTIWSVRRNYPGIEWEARGNFLYGRYVP